MSRNYCCPFPTARIMRARLTRSLEYDRVANKWRINASVSPSESLSLSLPPFVYIYECVCVYVCTFVCSHLPSRVTPFSNCVSPQEDRQHRRKNNASHWNMRSTFGSRVNSYRFFFRRICKNFRNSSAGNFNRRPRLEFSINVWKWS